MSTTASSMSDLKHNGPAPSTAAAVVPVRKELGEEGNKMQSTVQRTESRILQTGSLITKLPTEIHHQIFSYLTPIGQRLLGASSTHFYDMYKENYYENIFNLHRPGIGSGLPGTYQNVILINFEHDIERIYDSASSSYNEGYMKIISGWLTLRSHDGPSSNSLSLSDRAGWGSYVANMRWSRRRFQRAFPGPRYMVYSTKIFLQEY